MNSTMARTIRMAAARLRARGGEAGSGGGMSLILLTCAVALILVLGLVVDGGAKARAIDHAGAIASEAARAAAGTITPGAAAIDPVAAQRAARDYLAAAGASGTVNITGATVTVTATLHTKAVFLSLIGIDGFTVTGVGRAETVYSPGSTP